MEDTDCCPNIKNCQLIQIPGFVRSDELLNNYVLNFCRSETKSWESCKRFIVKKAINFCPDFVMPDTELSPDEIIDKFDALSMN